MAITLAKADVYFSEHVNGKAWDDFDDPDRERAIAHAQRIIQTRGGTSFSTEDTTISTRGARWDVAVYEQAFHMLKHSHLPRDGNSGAPRYLTDGEADPSPAFDVEKLADAALRYITGPLAFPVVEMRRG